MNGLIAEIYHQVVVRLHADPVAIITLIRSRFIFHTDSIQQIATLDNNQTNDKITSPLEASLTNPNPRGSVSGHNIRTTN